VTRPELSEPDWQDQVVELAQLYRWRIHHCRPAQNSRGEYSTPIQGDPGFPDLVLARGGRVLFVELKRNSGVLTGHQQAWRDVLLGSGAEWFCWRPRHIGEVRECLAPTWRDADLRLTEDVDAGGRT
jgi:hypothetical protein